MLIHYQTEVIHQSVHKTSAHKTHFRQTQATSHRERQEPKALWGRGDGGNLKSVRSRSGEDICSLHLTKCVHSVLESNTTVSTYSCTDTHATHMVAASLARLGKLGHLNIENNWQYQRRQRAIRLTAAQQEISRGGTSQSKSHTHTQRC